VERLEWLDEEDLGGEKPSMQQPLIGLPPFFRPFGPSLSRMNAEMVQKQQKHMQNAKKIDASHAKAHDHFWRAADWKSR
jgi:hypothetical protein